MYEYRSLTPEQREEILRYRTLMGYPRHSPPHLYDAGGWFLITAATYEHRPHLSTPDDRELLLSNLLDELGRVGVPCAGWVVIPNHHHLLVRPDALSQLNEPLRRAHARVALRLNRRDGTPGRQVWYRFSDRKIRSERHYFATLNYIHYNPVKHGYAHNALQWACSSVHWYLEHMGVEWLRECWHAHPLLDYGQGWDEYGSVG